MTRPTPIRDRLVELKRWGGSPASAITRRGALIAAALAAMMAAPPTVAHADFVVKMCNGNPSPPWMEGFPGANPWYSVTDNCTLTGGSYSFNNGAPSQMTYNTNTGAGISVPAGETLTHVTVGYHSLDASGGSLAFLQAGYGSTDLLDSQIGDDHAGTQFAVDVPNASSFWMRVYCSYSAGPVNCQWNTPYGVLQVGEMDLTLHDTGTPAVQATGGSLRQNGVVAGGQTVTYQASDPGSGVARVTLALGPVLVGTVQSTCYAWNLQPCPSSTTGTFDVDTRQLRDGTYPVTLTAYDVSGHATPEQISTATVRNGSGVGGIIGNFNPGPTFGGHVANGTGATPAARLRISFQIAARPCRTKRPRGARCRAHPRYVTSETRSYRDRQPVTLIGTLLNSGGQPISGARLLIAIASGGSPYRVAAQATTDGTGHFASELPAGASRLVQVTYWPFADLASYTSSNSTAVVVPAAATLHARPLGKHLVLFTGHVLTRPIPTQGIPLDLQVRIPEPNGRFHWQPFQGAQADATGRFRVRYRLAYRYAIRVEVRAEAGYPFAAGHSPAIIA